MIFFADDIAVRINRDFPKSIEKEFVKRELSRIAKGPLNVGKDQLARSILFLAQGDMEKFKQLIVFEDPRDVLFDAEELNGNPGHFFINPFDN